MAKRGRKPNKPTMETATSEITSKDINVIEAETVEPVTPKEDKKPKVNTAIVRNDGRQEVRKYTLDSHGKDFVEFAEGFAKKNGHTVELIYVDKKNMCPKCGHVIQ